MKTLEFRGCSGRIELHFLLTHPDPKMNTRTQMDGLPDQPPITDEAPFDDLTEEELAELAAEEALQQEEAVDELDRTQEELEKLKLERDDLKNQLLRSYADLQNFRRISQQRLVDARREAQEEVLKSLLPTLDNFERSLIALEKGADVDSVIQGIAMVGKVLMNGLEGFDLKRMVVVGQQFDPELHEAIATWVSPDHQDGVITDEIEAGYRIGERVIRPAKVRVVRNS